MLKGDPEWRLISGLKTTDVGGWSRWPRGAARPSTTSNAAWVSVEEPATLIRLAGRLQARAKKTKRGRGVRGKKKNNKNTGPLGKKGRGSAACESTETVSPTNKVPPKALYLIDDHGGRQQVSC